MFLEGFGSKHKHQGLQGFRQFLTMLSWAWILLPVVAAISDPDWEAFKHKYQKTPGAVVALRVLSSFCATPCVFRKSLLRSYSSKGEETARYQLSGAQKKEAKSKRAPHGSSVSVCTFASLDFRFKATKQRVEHLNKLNGEPAFGITWMADRYEEEKYKRPHVCTFSAHVALSFF